MPPPSIPNDIYQYSLLSAYESGLKDGGPPVAFLTNHGTHGIGYFETDDNDDAATRAAADDMMMVEGVAFRIDSTGAVTRAAKGDQMPFVMVTVFQPTQRLRVPKSTDRSRISSVVTSPGKLAPVPFRITGRFTYINTTQETLWDVAGTIFGFAIPEWQAAVSGTGLRSCFVSQDRSRGGHVLDFTTADGTALEWSVCGRFHLGFPQDEEDDDDGEDDD